MSDKIFFFLSAVRWVFVWNDVGKGSTSTYLLWWMELGSFLKENFLFINFLFGEQNFQLSKQIVNYWDGVLGGNQTVFYQTDFQSSPQDTSSLDYFNT